MSLTGNNCPHCKAPIIKELRADHFYSCSDCKKTFVFSTDTSSKDTFVPYNETLSPIVIGSVGKIKSESFEVTGCITLYQNDTVINLHTILWNYGLYSYIIEWDGKFSLISEINENPPAHLRNAKLGKSLDLERYGSIYCYASSKTESVSLSGEGKLFLKKQNNTLFSGFYHTQKKAVFAAFSRTESALFYGDFFELEDFHFSNTRLFNNSLTPSKIPADLLLPCPSCKRDIRIHSHYRALRVSCMHCGCLSRFDQVGRLTSLQSGTALKISTFKLGSKFKIEDKEFVLINILIKEETAYRTKWTEYGLFNPTEGCWTLNESEGHYTLLKPSDYYVTPFKTEMQLIIGNDTFHLYSKYKYKIKQSAGEFLTNPFSSALPACADYVLPPYIISSEATSNDIFWFKGEYCDHAKVRSWVAEDVDFPAAEGIAPNQPYLLNFEEDSLIRLSVIAFFFVILIQVILSSFFTTSDRIYSESFTRSDSSSIRNIVSKPFEISNDNCAVDVDLYANVYNSWLEGDFTLVNETTGDQYYFTKALEYYAGVEDGETWSEGSTGETITINEVKKGKYHLNFLLSSSGNNSYTTLTIKVIENVTLLKNFFVTLLLIAIFPAFIFLRKRSFDRKQWYNSNYSPYTYDE